MRRRERIVTLVADPPWQTKDKLSTRGKRGAVNHYPTMPLKDIMTFPLPPMAETSVLLLWRIGCMVEEAYTVVRAWGFVPKSEIVWEKMTKHGKRHMGMGRYTRWAHESCIIATRGPRPSQLRKVKNERSSFEAPYTGKHSGKPDEFFDKVERLFPGPYHELFARRIRPGWTQEGLELGERGNTGDR